MAEREDHSDDAPIPADDEPEPEWAEEIRRLRSERGKRLADQIEDPERKDP